jgi:Ca-activated chloride channel homolog
MKANPHNRRIFTFGVGVDVNTPLLERIANETRAVPTFILPDEDVEVKVGALFKRLTGPILADTVLVAIGPDGTSCVSEVMPVPLPDLFEDDQLVVVGRYKDTQDLRFDLSGSYLGRKRTFAFGFAMDSATTQNAFVPRLWASRRIAQLVDAIRQLGADGGGNMVRPTQAVPGVTTPPSDPRIKELVDEIVRLSLEFGILTEYTAFLALEGTDLSDQNRVVSETNDNLMHRAVRLRSGSAAVVQSMNAQKLGKQQTLNLRNEYLDDQMNSVTVSSVQQVSDRTFYLRKGRWVDSSVANQAMEAAPRRKVAFASREYFDLASRLAAENRQGSMAMRGDIVLMVDGEPVLVEGPGE